MSLPSVDLLELLRAALDELEPILAGRVVDIEMPRVSVLVDPVQFRQELSALIGRPRPAPRPATPSPFGSSERARPCG